MKCINCDYCKKGWYKVEPEKYVCIGVKHPFIISDINKECTEYQWNEIKTGEAHGSEPAKAFVDDDGIYVPSTVDSRYHTMLISRDLFVEAYNKWIKEEKENESN